MHESEKWKLSRSVVSDSSRPHGLQPTRLLCPYDVPVKRTGVGCHCLMSKDTQIHSHSQIYIYLVFSSCTVCLQGFLLFWIHTSVSSSTEKAVEKYVCVCVCVYKWSLLLVIGQEPDFFFFFFFEDLQMSLRISGSFDWTTWFPQEKKILWFHSIWTSIFNLCFQCNRLPWWLSR